MLSHNISCPLRDLIKQNCNVLNEILLKALNKPIKTSHKSNIVSVKRIMYITSVFAKMLTFIQRCNVEDVRNRI